MSEPDRLKLLPAFLSLGAAGLVCMWSLSAVSGELRYLSVGLGWVLLALSVFDLLHHRLPNIGTLSLLSVGLLLSVMGYLGPVSLHALAALLGYASFALVGWVYVRVRGIDGLGLGDAKLLAAAGAWTGLEGLPSVLLLGSLASLVVAMVQGLLRGGLQSRTAVPFGPGLALGFWITWLHGPIVLG